MFRICIKTRFFINFIKFVFIIFAKLSIVSAENQIANYSKTGNKLIIAHRGASDLAPEHTIASYELAIKLGADYVEQDLQLTKDNVLVCIHDETLERTTNVETIFPDRYKIIKNKKSWLISDFTLKELKTLDAGSWFNLNLETPKQSFKDLKILTFEEVVDLIGHRAGIIVEIKVNTDESDITQYEETQEKLLKSFFKVIDKKQILIKNPNKNYPFIVQSFDHKLLRRVFSQLKNKKHFMGLIEESKITDFNHLKSTLDYLSLFTKYLGPEKKLVKKFPLLVKEAQVRDLKVIPWTFSTESYKVASSLIDKSKLYKDELKLFMWDLKVDGGFLNSPMSLESSLNELNLKPTNSGDEPEI